MDDADKDALEVAMQGLRAEYLAEAPERVRELSAALGRLRMRDETALADLQRYFHRLAGSGGSYGFPDITTRSRAAEADVARLARDAQPLQRPAFTLLEQHVLGITEAFREAQRDFVSRMPR